MDNVKKLRRGVYEVIRDDVHESAANRLFNAALIALILLTVVFVVADSFDTPAWYRRLSLGFELFTIVVFTLEYLLRLWTAPEAYPGMSPAKARARFCLSFTGAVDLLATAPYYLMLLSPVNAGVLRTLRLVRLFMIVKVNRYTHALDTIAAVLRRKAAQLASSMMTVLMLMVIFSVLIYNVENRYQPEVFANSFSGLWWAVSTITTIGYGDIFPITVLGKVLGGILAVLGIGLIAVPTGIISAGFVEVLGEDGNRDYSGGLPKGSAALEIARFKTLRDEGVITTEEFERQKQLLLRLNEARLGAAPQGEAGGETPAPRG